MSLNRFQSDDTDESAKSDTNTSTPRVFPRIRPVEGGEVTLPSRGVVGTIHYLEDENALAYGVEKRAEDHYFYKFNGYAISVDILEELPDLCDELRADGAVPADATLDYVFFFIRDDREVLKFTLDQYLTSDDEYMNHEYGVEDLQYAVDEEEAVETWADGYEYVMKDPDYYNGYVAQ